MKAKLKILLIEDSDFSATITENMLKESKSYEYMDCVFDLSHVHLLSEAMSAISQNDYDVILLDLNLPDSLGIKTLTNLIHFCPDIPIIVLSNIDDFKLSHNTIKCGAQDYLIKGQYNIDMLIRSISYSIERFSMISALKELALIDELTGIFNRRAFLNLSDHRLKLAKRREKNVFFLFCDIDGLKSINDKFGHYEGDFVLKEFADVIKNSFRESDIVARYSGDEFIIFASNVREEDKEVIMQRIYDNLSIKNQQINKPYTISASFGTVLKMPDKNTTLEEIIREIDIRMYQEKERIKES
ncbi:MAG: GGDEF domain-containing response regulator [Clostridia bacterium]|nr:GGDEF domain-containing response regulator [Clostridia bacterium]